MISVQVGEKLELRCEATGNPLPTVYLLKDISDVIWHNQDFHNGTTARNVRTFKSVKLSDAGVYVCLASHYLVGPPGGKRKITDWKRIIVEVTGMCILMFDPEWVAMHYNYVRW